MRRFTRAFMAFALVGSMYSASVVIPDSAGSMLLPVASAAVQDNAMRLSADGFGVFPPGMPAAQARISARRAAILDAQRNLVGEIQGTQIDSETTVEMAMLKNDTIKSRISGIITGAHIVAEGIEPDGSYKVTMSVPAYGVGSVAEVAYQVLKEEGKLPPVPEPIAKPDPVFVKTYKPPVAESAVQSRYTGIIIDATGMELTPTYSPVIKDTNGKAIYGVKNIDADYAISNGVVEYASSTTVMGSTRAGANPLVIKAVSTYGRVKNKCDVVISVEDGNRILYENESGKFLEKFAVVFKR